MSADDEEESFERKIYRRNSLYVRFPAENRAAHGGRTTVFGKSMFVKTPFTEEPAIATRLFPLLCRRRRGAASTSSRSSRAGEVAAIVRGQASCYSATIRHFFFNDSPFASLYGAGSGAAAAATAAPTLPRISTFLCFSVNYQ